MRGEVTPGRAAEEQRLTVLHWLAWLLYTRGVDAMLKFATAPPLRVVRISGSAVRLPTR